MNILDPNAGMRASDKIHIGPWTDPMYSNNGEDVVLFETATGIMDLSVESS